MSSSALQLKTQGNEHYSKNESTLAIESYTGAIKLVLENAEIESPPLYILYSNRSAAHIQDEDYYCGYEDAKKSLKLKKDENFKGFYRAAVCAYHLGFIKRSEELIKEATEIYHQNLEDYSTLKLSIEKKIKCILRWRKPIATAKKGLKNLENIIDKGVLFVEMAPILYQIRYALRAYFENKRDKKLLNVNHGDLGLRLHELAVQFNSMYPVEKIFLMEPLFEDLILNEMPDVGLSRLNAHKQRNLPYDDQDHHLEEKAENDLTAYEFSFFVNNILASLVVNCSDERISFRALRQIHHLTTNDLYREALGDALSDAVNNYIYLNSKKKSFIENFFSNYGIEILFHDYVEALCELSTIRMIKQINIGHWKKQKASTIDFVLQQISQKIQSERIERKSSARFVEEIKSFMNWNFYNNEEDEQEEDEQKINFDLIVDVLTKISFIFGIKPFLNRSTRDPFFLFVKRNWFDLKDQQINQENISSLLNDWSSMINQWIHLHYSIRQTYLNEH